MLLDSSTGLDLNQAGTNLRGIDILWDVPGVVSIARLRYEDGTRMEISSCPLHLDVDDLYTLRRMIPRRALALKGWISDTLGCGHGDEYTTAYWVFE